MEYIVAIYNGFAQGKILKKPGRVFTELPSEIAPASKIHLNLLL